MNTSNEDQQEPGKSLRKKIFMEKYQEEANWIDFIHSDTKGRWDQSCKEQQMGKSFREMSW